VGFAGESAYGQRRISVGADDVLFLFTDGLPDAIGEANGMTGEQRVVSEVGRMMAGKPGEIVESLFRMTRSAASPLPADDRTALIVRTSLQRGPN
jgi:serine phosphatase RsbU (regulator of sigma subunit)